jgi:hypothetical protein
MRVGALSSEQVLGILLDERHPKDIAKAFHVNYNTVYGIKAGRTYAKITGLNRNDADRLRIESPSEGRRREGDEGVVGGGQGRASHGV